MTETFHHNAYFRKKGGLLLARILALLPSWITGRIGPRAQQEVHSWTKKNATLRTLQYKRFRHVLMWGTDHPVLFAVAAATLACGVAHLIAVQDSITGWKIVAPKMSDDFDIAAFAGVPWSVQATLVALVYPIVLSFIALTLQRKAHSTVSLRVYILDSGVVPAGASSIGLLVGMSVQYLATPYSTPIFLTKHMAPLLAANGTWLLINLLLTGFFLSRTIRFIQEEEQRHAFTRVTVDVALRSELTSAVKEHIFVNAAQSDWNLPFVSLNDGPEPRVLMFSVRDARSEVKRDLRGSLILYDVHLHFLRLVVTMWSRRASRGASANKGKTPTIIFPPMVGGVAFGEVVLCAVEDGPTLTLIERLLVSVAFVYRPARHGTLSLSTRKMLEEIGQEVAAAAEQQRFGESEERLRDVLRLHKTLLLASAVDVDATSGNAATIGTSPYSWGSSSFDQEWLKPYRDVGRIAVNQLDLDDRLFRTLAQIPASIAMGLPPRPEKLLIDVQMVGTNLIYQLAGWWTHKADASLLPGTTTFSGTLPAPLSKVYERAIVAFIGTWGNFRVRLPEVLVGEEAAAWHSCTGRALIYASHIDNLAQLFLNAVSRGDETASVWFLESLLKWWGNRQHELDGPKFEDDFRLRNVTLTLAEKDWSTVQNLLWDGAEPITIEFAKAALNLAIRKYWESMRLFLVLLLIQKAGVITDVKSRELRHASSLILGNAQRAGGTIDARSLSSVDAVLRSTLDNIFGVETAVARIDAFAENLRWDSEGPSVAGWIYGWSGAANDMESMKRPLVILLIALASTRRSNVGSSKKLIEQWWKNIDKLEQVARYCAELRQDARSDRESMQAAVSCLQGLLSTSHRPRFGQLAVARSLHKLQAVAQHERRITLMSLSVDASKVRSLAHRLATQIFEPSPPSPIVALNYVPKLAGPPMSIRFTDDKKNYVEGRDTEPDEGLVEHMSAHIRRLLLTCSFGALVANRKLKPINSPDFRGKYDASRAEMRKYISDVVAQCCVLRANGEEPVVLAGNSAAGSLLSYYKWGAEDWKCLPPPGIVVGPGAQAISLINGVAVCQFNTPNEDCFVLPVALLNTLAVAGADAAGALSMAFNAVGEDKLEFTLAWQAEFRSC